MSLWGVKCEGCELCGVFRGTMCERCDGEGWGWVEGMIVRGVIVRGVIL